MVNSLPMRKSSGDKFGCGTVQACRLIHHLPCHLTRHLKPLQPPFVVCQCVTVQKAPVDAEWCLVSYLSSWALIFVEFVWQLFRRSFQYLCGQFSVKHFERLKIATDQGYASSFGFYDRHFTNCSSTNWRNQGKANCCNGMFAWSNFQVVIRYVPMQISNTANDLRPSVFLSISSFRIFGKCLLRRVAKRSVNNGVVMLIVETRVIGPNEAA